MAYNFDYNDSVKEFLVSMSLEATFDKKLIGTSVGYGAEVGYSASSAASASIDLTFISQSMVSSGVAFFNLNGVRVRFTGSYVPNSAGSVWINTSSFANSTIDDYVTTASITINNSSSQYSAWTYISSSTLSPHLDFTSTTIIGTQGNLLFYVSGSTTTYFSGGTNVTSSISGAVALWDEDVRFTGNPALFITIPTASYLEPLSTISASLATFVDNYQGISLSGSVNSNLNTIIILDAGEAAPAVCDASCYQGEFPWYWYDPSGTSLVGPFAPLGPVPTNRNRIRPIEGGLSITSTSKSAPFNSQGSVGTMGLVCQDDTSNALVGLTNNHVVIRDAFYTSERTYNNPQNEFDLVDGNGSNIAPNSYTELVYQSGENQPVTGVDAIGRVIRYVPIYSAATTLNNNNLVNRVDGALFSINCSGSDNVAIVDFSSSFLQHNLSYTSSMPFASTAELNNLLNTNPELYSSGRTTGAKGSPGTLCPLRVFGWFTSTLYFNRQGVSTLATFTDLIRFIKPFNSASYTPAAGGSVAICPFPIWAGDSGSTLIANFSGTWKIIGLNFAGDGCPSPGVCSPSNGIIASSFGLACRIDHVAQELSIQAWTGSAVPVIDDGSIDYITVSGSNNIKTQFCSGSTYWQVGLTTHHNIC